MTAVALALLCMAAVLAEPVQQTPPSNGEPVAIPSGQLRLTGVLFRPKARTPVPAIVFHRPTGGQGFIFAADHPSIVDVFRFLAEHVSR